MLTKFNRLFKIYSSELIVLVAVLSLLIMLTITYKLYVIVTEKERITAERNQEIGKLIENCGHDK